MLTELLVVGAGGHAKVVIEAVLDEAPECTVSVVDQDPAKAGQLLLGRFVIQEWTQEFVFTQRCHIAIGNNLARHQLGNVLLSRGIQLSTVAHPNATISQSSCLAGGCFVAANALIGPESRAGKGAIINHGAIVDHDCLIGSYSHIAPNATLGGGVSIGQECLVGAGAAILPGVSIGDQVVIGAGAVVTRNVPDRGVVVGVPGRHVN